MDNELSLSFLALMNSSMFLLLLFFHGLKRLLAIQNQLSGLKKN